MATLWIIENIGYRDDYGTEYPMAMAVCTSDESATKLASGLWGHCGPGLPEDIRITRIESDELIPDGDS